MIGKEEIEEVVGEEVVGEIVVEEVGVVFDV